MRSAGSEKSIAKSLIDHKAEKILLLKPVDWWGLPNNLAVPENIAVLPLPPKSPELNPVENIWEFMRDIWLSNRTSNPTRIS